MYEHVNLIERAVRILRTEPQTLRADPTTPQPDCSLNRFFFNSSCYSYITMEPITVSFCHVENVPIFGHRSEEKQRAGSLGARKYEESVPRLCSPP